MSADKYFVGRLLGRYDTWKQAWDALALNYVPPESDGLIAVPYRKTTTVPKVNTDSEAVDWDDENLTRDDIERACRVTGHYEQTDDLLAVVNREGGQYVVGIANWSNGGLSKDEAKEVFDILRETFPDTFVVNLEMPA